MPRRRARGGVAERLNAAVLKTAGRKSRGFESHPLRQYLCRQPVAGLKCDNAAPETNAAIVKRSAGCHGQSRHLIH